MKMLGKVFLAIALFGALCLALATLVGCGTPLHAKTPPSPTGTANPTTATRLNSTQIEEKIVTVQNSVNALGWGYPDGLIMNNQQTKITGFVLFEDCQLGIVADVDIETAPRIDLTAIGEGERELTPDGYLQLRTELLNDPKKVEQLGWQNCWVEPAG